MKLSTIKRLEACSSGAKFSQVGLKQFEDFESKGIRPENPDSYFVRLWDGKAWWEWTVNNYASMWGTFEWPGWLRLYEDFIDDHDGFKQIVQRLRRDYTEIMVSIKEAEQRFKNTQFAIKKNP